MVFAGYLVLSGAARFLVEYLRINDVVLLGLTQPQLWALASIAVGLAIALRSARTSGQSRSLLDEPLARAGGTLPDDARTAIPSGN